MQKSQEVSKFGGTEELGKVELHGHTHEAATVEALSETKLEHDEGYGNAAIIRCFTFGMNPKTFQEVQPTKQDLFNSHIKGIELALWRDGLKVMPDVEPRITFNTEKMQYQIFIAATPQRGHILHQKPMTLSEIAHG